MSKEQRQKSDETRGPIEKKDSHFDEKELEEIRWFENYERRLRAEAAESFKSRDFLNFFRNIRREYCGEISSDDDYRSSSIREFEDVRPVRSVKGKKTRSLRTKQGFRSRHRKARPKRKRIRELVEYPSRSYEICEACCPPYERTRRVNDDNAESSYARYLLANRRRPKLTYPASRLLKRYSSRLVSPNAYGRYLKRGTREWQAVDGFEVIKSCPDQRLSRIKNDEEHRSESVSRPVRKSNFEETPKKRSTDSIYINPRFERGYFDREETAPIRKESEVQPCVLDKTNESSFQKRLSGGSNFSGSTNNQYCSRLNGPSSCEEEEDAAEEENRKGANKSRSPRCEKDEPRKEERKIRGKFDWIFKDPPCVVTGPRCPNSRSFTSLSSARSAKGVTFERNVSKIPSKTPRQVTKSNRKCDKAPFVEKRVHYEPKCVRTAKVGKEEEENECCFCQNERLEKSDRRYRKLCKLVRSREGKKLLECCCCGDEQEDDAECNQACCCPENLKMFQARPQYDTSRSYERSWKGKDILHSTSLPGTNFGPSSSGKLVDDTCYKKKVDRPKDPGARDPVAPDVSLSDHWKKCKDRLNDFNEEYRKLSDDVKTIREIYGTRDKATRKKTDRFYPSTEKDISFEGRRSPRRTKDSRSPSRPNEIQETDCDCTKFLDETSPSACPYDRYARSYDRCDARHAESRKKLERDSVRKLENFCDRVKAMNRQPFESKPPKTNLESRTLNEDRTWCDCRYESETSVQELWRPSSRSGWKEWPVGNSVDLRIVKPKKSSGKANLEKILIYPPEGAAGPPLTLFKNSSNISCQVKGDADHGFRYNVTYIQKFVSPCWRPVECPANDTTRRTRNECDCSSDYG